MPPSRSPPKPTPALQQGDQALGHESGFDPADNPGPRLTHEIDPDFREFVRREEIEKPEPTWEP